MHLIDLRRDYKIALSQTSDFVRVNLHVHPAPRQAKIRMMAFLLRDGAHAVHEIERCLEIGKQKTLRDMVLFDDFPVRQLLGESHQYRAFQRRDAAPARYAVLFG
jgi:hypothetical protein